jgi:hypothetical protein
MRNALLVLVPFAIHVALVVKITRYRTDKPPWLELWRKAVDPKNYSPQGRRLIPWLYASAMLFGVGVVIVVVTS